MWYFLLTKIRLCSFQNNTTELVLHTPQCRISGDTCVDLSHYCWYFDRLVKLVPADYCTAKLTVFFVINKYLVGREGYKYAVSHHTFSFMNLSIHWWFHCLKQLVLWYLPNVDSKPYWNLHSIGLSNLYLTLASQCSYFPLYLA